MAESLTDFNDLARVAGLDAVREQLHQARESLRQRKPERGIEADWPTDDAPGETMPPVDAYSDAYSGGNFVSDEGGFKPMTASWYKQLDRTKDGNGPPKHHAGNIERILELDPRWSGVLSYCDFSYRVLLQREPPSGWTKQGELSDDDVARLRIWLHRQYWMNPPQRGDVVDAVLVVAQRRRSHPVRSYLRKLRWDETPRLAKWLAAVFDARGNPEYLKVVGTKFLIGAVARVMAPGCKMDNVLILEGDQGKGKSTALRELFGADWFSDAPLPLGEKDAYQLIQGVWGYEMAELDAFNKSETTSAKAFFSQLRDRFRPPYGHAVADWPRQTIFCGTTNQDEYLKDYSGNRRYWPVFCRTVDVEWLKLNRDQLWAEAVALYDDHVTWWVHDEVERKLCEAEQDARLQRDPWEYGLAEYLAGSPKQYFTSYELLTQAIDGLDAGHITRAHQNRLAPIMKAFGWERERRRLAQFEGEGAGRHWVYVRPSSEQAPPGMPSDEVSF